MYVICYMYVCSLIINVIVIQVWAVAVVINLCPVLVYSTKLISWQLYSSILISNHLSWVWINTIYRYSLEKFKQMSVETDFALQNGEIWRMKHKLTMTFLINEDFWASYPTNSLGSRINLPVLMGVRWTFVLRSPASWGKYLAIKFQPLEFPQHLKVEVAIM